MKLKVNSKNVCRIIVVNKERKKERREEKKGYK
jgi:hypothetical protein